MPELKIGVVGIPGKWSTEALADAIEQATGFRLVIDMAQVKLDLQTQTLDYHAQDLSQLDGLIIKKISEIYNPNILDRLELLRIAQAQGVKIFSAPEKILRLIDRLSCTVTLRQANIPMPATIVTEDCEQALQAVHQFGEAVFKPLYSTKARGMQLLDKQQSEEELIQTIQDYRQYHPMMYIQQKIALPGKDLGLVFLDGKYMGCYARQGSKNAWNTTIQSGGRYQPFTPPDDYIALAKRAQDLFGLDFTTVDLAETDAGPVIFEVSAFGGFRGALEGAGIDAAAAYSQHVIKQIHSRRQQT